MTVKDYRKWKEAGCPDRFKVKNKSVIAFWKTNPTEEQERIRSSQILYLIKIIILFGIFYVTFGLIIILFSPEGGISW